MLKGVPWPFKVTIVLLCSAFALIGLGLPLAFIFGKAFTAGPAMAVFEIAVPVLMFSGVAALIFGGFYETRKMERVFVWATETAVGFLGALAAEDSEKVLKLLSAEMRRRVSPADVARIARHPHLVGLQSCNIPTFDQRGSAAVLSGSITGEAGTVGVEVHLVEVARGWEVTGVTLAGTPLLES